MTFSGIKVSKHFFVHLNRQSKLVSCLESSIHSREIPSTYADLNFTLLLRRISHSSLRLLFAFLKCNVYISVIGATTIERAHVSEQASGTADHFCLCEKKTLTSTTVLSTSMGSTDEKTIYWVLVFSSSCKEHTTKPTSSETEWHRLASLSSPWRQRKEAF